MNQSEDLLEPRDWPREKQEAKDMVDQVFEEISADYQNMKLVEFRKEKDSRYLKLLSRGDGTAKVTLIRDKDGFLTYLKDGVRSRDPFWENQDRLIEDMGREIENTAAKMLVEIDPEMEHLPHLIHRGPMVETNPLGKRASRLMEHALQESTLVTTESCVKIEDLEKTKTRLMKTQMVDQDISKLVGHTIGLPGVSTDQYNHILRNRDKIMRMREERDKTMLLYLRAVAEDMNRETETGDWPEVEETLRDKAGLTPQEWSIYREIIDCSKSPALTRIDPAQARASCETVSMLREIGAYQGDTAMNVVAGNQNYHAQMKKRGEEVQRTWAANLKTALESPEWQLDKAPDLARAIGSMMLEDLRHGRSARTPGTGAELLEACGLRGR